MGSGLIVLIADGRYFRIRCMCEAIVPVERESVGGRQGAVTNEHRGHTLSGVEIGAAHDLL